MYVCLYVRTWYVCMYVCMSRCRHKDECHNWHGSSNALRVIMSRRVGYVARRTQTIHPAGIPNWLVATGSRSVLVLSRYLRKRYRGVQLITLADDRGQWRTAVHSGWFYDFTQDEEFLHQSGRGRITPTDLYVIYRVILLCMSSIQRSTVVSLLSYKA